MPAIAAEDHLKHAALFRRLLSVYARSEDLVKIGAYKTGMDPDLDRAIAGRAPMRRYMIQESSERVTLTEAVRALEALVEEL